MGVETKKDRAMLRAGILRECMFLKRNERKDKENKKRIPATLC